MSIQKINDIASLSIFLILLSLCFIIFQPPQTVRAQFWGISNPWVQSPFLSPYQNSFQSPFQNLWQSPLQNQWGNTWSASWQSPWQISLQSPWQSPWQNSWQYSWQNPSQYPWQNQSQYPWQNQYQYQYPWQNPSQYPWQNPWANPFQPQYQTADVDLDENDDESAVTVSVGESISIILSSNVSTGYQWVLDSNQPNASIVSKIGNQYFPGTPNLVGSVGSEQWIFEAEGTGVTTIKLDYKRAWETTVQDSFTIEVTVE